MNDIITALSIGMLSGSFVSLFVSLFRTFKVYKRHVVAKKELEILKKDKETKIEEILNTQEEIIKILDNMKNLDKESAIEVLENTKKELEEKHYTHK